MSDPKYLSVVVPTYNELENISILIPQIEELMLDSKINGEIIIVDDNSPDGTCKKALELNKKYKNIKAILRKDQKGIGSALRDGYNAAKGSVILSIDSDLSFNTKDILRLTDKIKDGYDLVVGSRHMGEGSYEKKQLSTFIKSIISKFGNKIVTFVSGVKIHDFSANFRAIKKSTWNLIRTKENTNTILLEMILKTEYAGYNVTEIPVTFKERIYGESKLNLLKESPKFFIKLIIFVMKYRF